MASPDCQRQNLPRRCLHCPVTETRREAARKSRMTGNNMFIESEGVDYAWVVATSTKVFFFPR
jgi:hypothetical protein